MEQPKTILKVKGLEKKTLDLIKHFESLHDGDLNKIGLQPKMDPIGIWTVAWGRALVNPKTNKFLQGEKDRSLAYHLFPTLTPEEADLMLEIDLKSRYIPILNNMLMSFRDNAVNPANLKPHEYGALLCFVYNCGTHYKNSLGVRKPFAIWENVLKYKKGLMTEKELRDYWKDSVVRAQGKVLPGLQRRRKSEVVYFLLDLLEFERFAF